MVGGARVENGNLLLALVAVGLNKKLDGEVCVVSFHETVRRIEERLNHRIPLLVAKPLWQRLDTHQPVMSNRTGAESIAALSTASV